MKKKLTMLLASLFLVLGTAWGQTVLNSTPSTILTSLENISDEMFFVMQTADEYGMNLWLKDESSKMIVNNGLTIQQESSTSYLWKIIKSGEYYKIQNVATGKYFPTLVKNSQPSTVESANAGSFILIDRKVDGEGKWNIKNQGDAVCLNVSGWWNFTSANTTGWDSEGGNSNYKIFVADVVDLKDLASELTLEYYFDGNIVETTKVKVNKGESYTIPALPFTSIASCKLGENPIEATFSVPNTDATITIILNDAFPYKKTTLVDGEFPADAAWYVMKQNSTNQDTKTWKYENGVYVERNEDPSTYTEKHLWCFAGNVFNLKIYSKVAGSTMVLSATNPASMAESNSIAWKVVESAAVNNFNGLYPFCLQKGSETSYLNISGTQLKYYGQRDGGSTIRAIEAYPLTVNYTCGNEDLTAHNVNKVVIAGSNYSIEPLDGYRIASCTVNGQAVDAVDGAYAVTVNAATEVVVTLKKNVEVSFQPEAGKMYALKENTTGLYVDIQTLGIHESGHTTNSMSLNYNPCIIYFEAGNGGKWKMKNINGTYAGNFTSGRHWNTTISSTAYEWTITAKDGDLNQLTISKDASNYIGWDKNKDITAGSALYNNAEGGNKDAARLYFTLVEYTSADLNPQGYYSLKLKDENTTFYLNFTESGDTKATLQNTPTYFHILPSANKNYLIFQNKDNANQYLGHPAGKWATTYDCKLWQVSEADEDGLVLISRHAGDGGDGGNNFGTNESIEEGKRLYTNVKDNCKRWLIEGVFDCPTIGTVKNGNYEFKSAPIRYLNACNKIRFTLTESGAFFQNGAKRMSLDEFVLYDAKGKKVELTAKNVTGNNNKTYEGMFDGVNDNFAGTATWNDGTEDDYFEILLPKGVDLGGAFSFSFVTENTTMNAKAFKIETSYQKINSIVYTFVVDAPESHAANATYNGSVIADDQTFEEDDFDVELFAADEISGYTWKVVVDDESATITLVYTQAPIVTNPEAVVALVKRIGGDSAADKFKFVLDPSINSKQETFVIGSEKNLILIKGSTLSALTTGLGWYLNNIAHINIAWNSLNEKTVSGAAYVDLTNIELPLPAEETHTSDAKYRYYLNYCTFGYSMTSWTWKRWQQEIDWMALHGINMPLQIVGLEEVWRKFLSLEKYKYTAEEAKAFVPGPAFTAWWGMNNLEGWGGTSADGWDGVQDNAWYLRQQALATQILDRQRELGMEPVLPGFSGMVPSNFAQKTGVTTLNPGGWGGFTRPHIIAPGNEKFAEIAKDYYQCLEEVMGTSKYYSMDPFHEGAGHLASVEGYATIYDAMEAAQPGSQWVIQQWQWDNGNQKLSLQGVPAGKLIVLDLFSDGKPEFDAYSYNGYAPQDAVFCVIPNFGGRSGLMGRLNTIAKNYFYYKDKHATIKGIGAAPEAIEQTPVTYDLLFQLPWMNGQVPDVKAWVEDYAIARYGKDNRVVKEAWELLREGVLNYGTDRVQGPVEDVWAARPNLDANKASSWGTTLAGVGSIYTPARRQMLIDAVYKLIEQEDELALTTGSVYESNYLYDLVEFGGAVMADYAYDLLLGIRDAKNAGNTALYEARRDAFLQLILDMDAFRGTNLNFRLGKWTQEARDAAKEAKTYGATTANEDWYEFNNARTIITTWGDANQNGNGNPGNGLKDYSYRSWQGLLADYYYPRWKYYFDNECTHPNGNAKNYFFFEWNWAHGMTHQVGDTQKSSTRLTEGATGYSYSRDPEGNTVEKAVEMLGKYIIPIAMNDGTTYYAYRTFTTDLKDKATVRVAVGGKVDFTKLFNIPNDAKVSGTVVKGDSPAQANAVPVQDEVGNYIATITLADGTELSNITVVLVAMSDFKGVYTIALHHDNISYDTYIANNGGRYELTAGQNVSPAVADKMFTIVPSSVGYTFSAQGQYLKTPKANSLTFSSSEKDMGAYIIERLDGDNEYKLRTSNKYLKADEDFLFASSNDASTFTITEAETFPFSVSGAGMATLCLPFNVVMADGMYAYDLARTNIKAEDEEYVCTMKAVAAPGETLKKGTPVIIQAKEGTYYLAITMDETNAKGALNGSLLKGNFVKQDLTQSETTPKFIFAKVGAEVGFYYLTDGTSTIGANKCWLEWDMTLGQVANSISLRFDDGSTDIEHIETIRPTQLVIYNILGQRLDAPQKGINIINGKKVLIK